MLSDFLQGVQPSTPTQFIPPPIPELPILPPKKKDSGGGGMMEAIMKLFASGGGAPPIGM